MSKARWTMDEHIRVSDADRERVVERLHEHFAAGRLTSDELDGRVSAALNAKTVGDLRPILTDLPEPELTGTPVGAGGLGGASGLGGPGGASGPGWPDSQAWQSSPWAVGGRPMVRLSARTANPAARPHRAGRRDRHSWRRLDLPGVLQDRGGLRSGHVRPGRLRCGPVPAPCAPLLAIRRRRQCSPLLAVRQRPQLAPPRVAALDTTSDGARSAASGGVDRGLSARTPGRRSSVRS